ncbi:hypothetical protein BV898_08051 [Hypsibius exemplaris]|uniref:G-protein coupled receptors family 1 profile domain-containing protein n=1 Tax=Hypsibius exemplaris TaxID=2072580 RepID=A0A1W0WRV7_HYPEX|nr:hypothetical protein BV898_08051 [Hypsibius exemplaris]
MSLAVLVFSIVPCAFNAYTSIVGAPNFLTDLRNRWLCESIAFLYMKASPTTTSCTPRLAYMFPLMRLGGELGYNPAQRQCLIIRITSIEYYRFVRSFYLVFSVTIISLCYTMIAVTVTRTRRRIGATRQTTATSQLRKLSRQIDVTKTAVKTYALFVVCFAPSNVYGLIAPNDLSGPVGLTFLQMYQFGEN